MPAASWRKSKLPYQHSELIPFSCKQRFICSSCDAKRALLFGEHLSENVLFELPHAHQVWSIPKILRPRFRFNRKLLNLLFHAAWESWGELIDDALPGCKPASVMALHTAGDLLHFHPHVHSMTLCGGVDQEGAFHALDTVNTDYLANCFARNLLDALVNAKEIDYRVVALIQGWEHSGFHVFSGEPIDAADTEARLFVCRYLKKSAVSNSRIELIETSTEPTVKVHKNTSDFKSHRDFHPLEFLAELAAHVPARFEQTVRYLGAYSARTRGAKRLALDTPGPLPVTEPAPRPSASWARCMKKVFELNPLECPKCGGEMRVKAFITDSKEITRLAQNLGIQAWRAPPIRSSLKHAA